MHRAPDDPPPGPDGPAPAAGDRTPRRLLVLRHAKSAWPPGVPDHERPLGPRGLRDAPAAGDALAAPDRHPDLALCSTAVRARRTWDLAAARRIGTPAPVRHDPRLYAADVPDLLAVVHETPAAVRTLLLVGHNPGLQDLVLALADPDRDATGGGLAAVREKFPTSAVAELTWDGPGWPDLTPGTARLTWTAVPRGREDA
ncbi:SixA phosphatase family protein [Streptomyces sp. NPDC091281]|uniref:SixA phosphatase family protein n=1 Tax=Streptomyces sp. NPDC091281 TaxID=3365985 RepID=UPI003815E244